MFTWWDISRFKISINRIIFKQLADVERIDRFREPPKAGLFCDILWADPVENEELYDEIHYRGNDTRGCSWFFGEKAV